MPTKQEMAIKAQRLNILGSFCTINLTKLPTAMTTSDHGKQDILTVLAEEIQHRHSVEYLLSTYLRRYGVHSEASRNAARTSEERGRSLGRAIACRYILQEIKRVEQEVN